MNLSPISVDRDRTYSGQFTSTQCQAGLVNERWRVRVRPGRTQSFYADSYFGIRSNPVLPQQYVRDPGNSAKLTAGGILHLNTHASYVRGFERHCTLVHGCMVRIESTRRLQLLHVAPAT